MTGSQDTALRLVTSPSRPAPAASHPLCSCPVPPVFPSREPRTLTVTEGHPARLSCECRGVPFPKISWRKDGRMAASLPRPGRLLPALPPPCPRASCNGVRWVGFRPHGVGCWLQK